MVIGTSSRKEVLQDMDMLSSFSAVVRVSNLSTAEHLLGALEDLQAFSQQELQRMAHKIDGKR